MCVYLVCLFVVNISRTIHMYMYTFMYVCRYIFRSIDMFLHLIYLYILIYIYVCVCACVFVYVYYNIFTEIHSVCLCMICIQGTVDCHRPYLATWAAARAAFRGRGNMASGAVGLTTVVVRSVTAAGDESRCLLLGSAFGGSFILDLLAWL